jgi:hypothetical protein
MSEPKPPSKLKPLTAKQQAFAENRAAGISLSQARVKAGYATGEGAKYRRAETRRGWEQERQPEIAEEIRRQTWLKFPDATDLVGMRAHALRVLRDLSAHSSNEELRFRCALSLLQIAEATRHAANPRATPVEQDRVLRALRGFYDKIDGMVKEVAPTNPGLPAPSAEEEPIDIQAIGEADEPDGADEDLADQLAKARAENAWLKGHR